MFDAIRRWTKREPAISSAIGAIAIAIVTAVSTALAVEAVYALMIALGITTTYTRARVTPVDGDS